MKKALIVAAIATAFTSAANAQSTVTLYGLVDAGIAYQSNVNGNSSWKAISGGASESRFGLRGSEDLGNGLRGIFVLESGFSITNGSFDGTSTSGIFNRQAYVGLSSVDYGTVTFGRQYDTVQDFISPFTAGGSWGGTFFSHYGNFDNTSANYSYSANNTVKYKSADYYGLRFAATYSFSNSENFSDNRAYSAGLSYQFEGLRIGAAYSQMNSPGSDNAGGAFDGSGITSKVTPALGQSRNRIYGVGASYAFGPALVGLAWTQARLDQLGDQASAKISNYEINALYNFTSALSAGIAYTYSNGTIDQKFHTHQIGGMLDYALSKRTDAYVGVVYQRANNIGASLFSGDYSAAPSTSNNQTAALVGVRHRF